MVAASSEPSCHTVRRPSGAGADPSEDAISSAPGARDGMARTRAAIITTLTNAHETHRMALPSRFGDHPVDATCDRAAARVRPAPYQGHPSARSHSIVH